jgi:RecG-like helicase
MSKFLLQKILVEVGNTIIIDSFLASLLEKDINEWTGKDEVECFQYFLTEIKEELNNIGYDVDLLEGAIGIVYLKENDKVLVTVDSTQMEEVENILINVSAAKQTKNNQWIFKASPENIEVLRNIVKKTRIPISDDAVSFLKETANRPVNNATPVEGLVDVTSRNQFLIKSKLVKELVDDVSTIPGSRWQDALQGWTVPRSRVYEVKRIIEKYQLDSSTKYEQMIEEMTSTIPYDGNLSSLKDIPLNFLHTVDDKKAERFKEFGVENIFDLLMLAPRRYIDRSNAVKIKDLIPGNEAALIGVVKNINADSYRRMVKIDVSDGTGILKIVFFNALWQAKRFKTGDHVIVSGKVEEWKNATRRTIQMANPMMDPFNEDTIPIIPVYPQSGKSRVTTWEVHQAVKETLQRVGTIQDPLPEDLRKQQGYMDRDFAIKTIHLPTSSEKIKKARDRLAFDEFIMLQASLLLSKHDLEKEQGIQHKLTGEYTTEIINDLPFNMTSAQTRVWEEIQKDLSSPYPMHRLLQGDVGAGKAQPLDSLVLTIDGYKKMGELKLSDIIVTPNGETSKIIGIYPQGKRPVWEILFNDNTRVEADENHLWEIYFEENKTTEPNILNTLQVQEELKYNELFLPTVDLNKISVLLKEHCTSDSEIFLNIQDTQNRLKTFSYNKKIVSLKYVGEKETQCIKIDHPQSLYITDNFTATHNTVVATLTLLGAIESGQQAALMAPTEILATQLYNEISDRIKDIKDSKGNSIRAVLLTNKLRGKNREKVLEELKNGDIHIAVGTHALIVGDIDFKNLSVVVVDEQHRFGVEQRATLRQKGNQNMRPDMLVMTATPIPRTAAMTVFGDLESSILDELPPGRTPIETIWIDQEPQLDAMLGDPWETIREEVKKGHQAYVVCPLVEESEKLQVANATETYEALSHGALNGLKLGLVHGQQKTDDRSMIMNEFREGKIDVLVATTVIEVGVNVPNATVIAILDSGRFGIAQLHQLRGRVGRGLAESKCFLVGRCVTPDSRARMQALCDSTDGFYLSEVDLEIRGPGSVFGTQQSGMSDLRIADFNEDKELLFEARKCVEKLMLDDPDLDNLPQLKKDIKSMLGENANVWLGKS